MRITFTHDYEIRCMLFCILRLTWCLFTLYTNFAALIKKKSQANGIKSAMLRDIFCIHFDFFKYTVYQEVRHNNYKY